VEEIRRRASRDDKPLRMVKTILHELCKLKGSDIYKYTGGARRSGTWGWLIEYQCHDTAAWRGVLVCLCCTGSDGGAASSRRLLCTISMIHVWCRCVLKPVAVGAMQPCMLLSVCLQHQQVPGVHPPDAATVCCGCGCRNVCVICCWLMPRPKLCDSLLCRGHPPDQQGRHQGRHLPLHRPQHPIPAGQQRWAALLRGWVSLLPVHLTMCCWEQVHRLLGACMLVRGWVTGQACAA
jgi:hypothetical protein